MQDIAWAHDVGCVVLRKTADASPILTGGGVSMQA